MIEIFQNIVALSIQIGILIGIVLLLGYFTKKKYMAVGRYFLWLVLAVRLLIPINMGWVNIEELKQGMENFFVLGTEEQNTEKTADKNLSNTKKNAWKETKTKEKKITSQSATKILEEDKTLEQNQVSEGVVREGKNTGWIVLSMIWILGILAMTGYEVIMYQSVYKSIQRWKMPVPKEYRQIFAQVCKEMHVTKEIPVYQCAKVASPMIVGIFKPSVILPDREYEKESLYYIYRHELTHFCHRDLYYKLIQSTVRCIYWFHPLVHAMYWQAAFDVELVCDEKVTKNQSETFCREYSLVLLDTLAAQNQRRVPISTCFFQGGKKQMKERFVRIMSQNKKKYGIGLFGLLIACALVLGNVSLHPKAKQDVSKTQETISNKEKQTEDIIDKRVEALHPVVVDGEKNVMETLANLDNLEYGISGDIDTLSETAEEIVGGTIQAVTYDEIEGLAWMKADVLITDSLKGNLKQNDMISIYMPGGYISLEEYMKYHDDKMPYNMTKQEMKKTVMKEVVEGEAFPQKGEKNIFYLSKTSSDSPLPSDAYERIRGKYAELDVIREHETVRGCIPGDDGATIENYTWKEIKRKAKQ